MALLLSAAKWMDRLQMHKASAIILHIGFTENLPISDVFYTFSEQRDDMVIFDPVINLFTFPPGDHQFHLAQSSQDDVRKTGGSLMGVVEEVVFNIVNTMLL